jgi:hypothetical protein
MSDMVGVTQTLLVKVHMKVLNNNIMRKISNLHSSLDRRIVMDFVKIYHAVVSLSYGSVYMYVFYIEPLCKLFLSGGGML